MNDGAPEDLQVLASRVAFVERLTDQPLHKADLVERSDASRSTVNRAIKELEDRGFVERVTEGYVATQAGRLAAERYREFVASGRSILDARAVLAGIPHDVEVPTAIVTEGIVESSDPGYRLFELLAEELEAVDDYRIALPALPDSRPLRLVHDRVLDDGVSVTLQAPEDVLTEVAREFPHLWDELVSADAFRARVGEAPPFGLFLSAADDGGSVTVVTTDGEGFAGFVHASDPAATRWARERWAALEATTGDASDVPTAADLTADLPPLTGERLPERLRGQGFVRVDDRYFDRRSPMDPTTAWRAGLDLPEIAAGYAVERIVDAGSSADPTGGDAGDAADTTTSLSGDLLDRLRDGANVALVGPPGSGKSTVCKSVACQWYEAESGPVFYRESGMGRPFESVAALESILERADGRALVVVEDAVRPEASSVFEVLRSTSGRDDVAFLFDARESEWHDPEEFPVDARTRAFRREAVETVAVPAFGEDDCRRLVERVESVTGESLEIPVEDLLADLRRATDDEGASPGEVSLLFHRLSGYFDPLTASGARTTLDEDVDRVRRDLAAIGDVALDVGVLVNLLNAAGIGVYPAYVHTVAAGHGAGGDDEVREALDRLEGHVLFPGSGADDPYRGVHETWSARFLERFLEEGREAAAQRRFGRCVTAVLSLADDPDVRDAVTSATTSARRALEPVVAAPADWTAETVSAMFGLGRAYPKLAPLFGTSGESVVEMPECCPAETRIRCAEWRGRMYADAGRFDAAEAEFDRLASDAESLSEELGDRMHLKGLLGRSDVAQRRGELDATVEYARQARELAEDLGATSSQARALRSLGSVSEARGEFETAREHFERSLELYREAEDRHGQAEVHKEIGDVGMKLGETERAREQLEQALELFRETDDRKGQAGALGTLGSTAMKENDLAAAREYLRRSLDIYRELGIRGKQAASLSNLGNVALRAGNYATAREYFRESLEIDEAVGNRHGRAVGHNCLADVEQKVGDLAAAREHLERSLELYREVGDTRGEAFALGCLGSVALQDEDLSAAEEYHRRSLELRREVGDRKGRADSLEHLGTVARHQGDLAEAREYHERALAIQRECDDRNGEAITLGSLGVVAHEAGDLEEAREYYRESLDIVRSAELPMAKAHARRDLGRLERDTGAPEDALEHFEEALSLFADAGAVRDELDVRAHLVETTIETGDEERAREELATARERLEAVDLPVEDELERIDGLEAELGTLQ